MLGTSLTIQRFNLADPHFWVFPGEVVELVRTSGQNRAMARSIACQGFNSIRSLALLLSLSVSPAALTVEAIRSPPFMWRTAAHPPNILAPTPHSEILRDQSSSLLSMAKVVNSLAALQVQSAKEGESETGEGGSGGETDTVQSAISKDQDSSSESTGGSESTGSTQEERPSKVTTGGSKADEKEAAGHKSPVHQSASSEEPVGESGQEKSSQHASSSAARAASGSSSNGGSASEIAAAHAKESPASESEAVSKGASHSEVSMPESAHEHAAANHAKSAEAQKPADWSAREPTVKGSELHAEEAGAAAGPQSVPSADKMVVQLSFRPSLVLGRGEGDSVDRHVVKEAGGISWYQVTGKKDMTILKLKPLEGEKVLHREVVAEQLI
ncbi:hypothetical protein Efla_005466 [Eimeria flavescens]